MSEVGKSMIEGMKEALEWKQGKNTGARVHYYSAWDIENVKNLKNQELKQNNDPENIQNS